MNKLDHIKKITSIVSTIIEFRQSTFETLQNLESDLYHYQFAYQGAKMYWINGVKSYLSHPEMTEPMVSIKDSINNLLSESDLDIEIELIDDDFEQLLVDLKCLSIEIEDSAADGSAADKVTG